MTNMLMEKLISKKTNILKYAGVFVLAFTLIGFVFPLIIQAQDSDSPFPPPPPRYKLEITSTVGGGVTAAGNLVNAPVYFNTVDEVNPLIATPDSSYQFVNWTGDTEIIDNINSASTNITINDAAGNYSITANFEVSPPPPPRYKLEITSTVGGSVTNPGEGTFYYDTPGEVIPLTATQDSGYKFVNWTGDTGTIADVNSANTTITMSDTAGNYSITANFEAIPVRQYTLNISSTDGGSVTTPGEGSFTYDEGHVVDLVATPNSCHRFVNWTGDTGTIADVNSANTTITMNSDYSITANFRFTCGGGGVTNYAPTANAGPDKEVNENELITLEGSGSDPDGDPITFSWSCEKGELSDSTIAQSEYTAPEVIEDTYYTCTLTVSDIFGLSGSDEMKVLVKNQGEGGGGGINHPPIAEAGEDQEIYELGVIILKGSGFDADGDPITFKWSCTGGVLAVTDRAVVVYIGPAVDSNAYYTCTLTVTDDKGASGSDSMNVLVKNVIPSITPPITPPVTPPVIPPVTGGKVAGLTVENLAKNLTQNQTEWRDSISASPSDEIEFQVKVSSVGEITAEDITVVDVLPAKISYLGDLKIDGEQSGENIIEGIKIGDLSSNASKTFTFKAKIDSKENFNYGSTYLVNGIRVDSSNSPLAIATLTIEVQKTIFTEGMAGILTLIGGIPNLFWIGLILLIILILIIIYFLFSRSKRIREKILKIRDKILRKVSGKTTIFLE